MPYSRHKLGIHLVALAVLTWCTYGSLTEGWVPLLDSANLVFHEAGHWVFGWGPEWLTVLGGTLMQLLVPLVCVVAFTRERKRFEARLMVWWTGQNLVNVSAYIADARAQRLPLLGGDAAGHDWAYLLGHTGLIAYDAKIAALVAAIGTALMLYMLLEAAVHAWPLVRHRFHR